MDKASILKLIKEAFPIRSMGSVKMADPIWCRPNLVAMIDGDFIFYLPLVMVDILEDKVGQEQRDGPDYFEMVIYMFEVEHWQEAKRESYLKKSRRERFAMIDDRQALAIYEWLKYLGEQCWIQKTLADESLPVAIESWRKRVGVCP